MKILLIKYRNIGDVLLSTPLIKNLKEKYPRAQIDFACNKDSEPVITLNPNLCKIIAYDRFYIKSLSSFNKYFSELQFAFSFRKTKYDVVINLTEGDRGNLICLLSKAPVRIGYKSNNRFLKNALTHIMPKQDFRHTIETNLDPLRILNIPILSKKVELFWSQNDEKIISEKLSSVKNKFIHIHPVSRWLFKCISDQTMAQIIDFCQMELNEKVVITSAPVKAEINKINNILSLCKSKPINLSGELSLKQTASLNNRAKLFIGVDTSIMHISASNDIPVLAFFGPSGADHWGPWDNNLFNSGYLERSGIQHMGMHRVFSEKRLCQPCGKDGCNGSKISDCLMSMDFEIIKIHIKEMLFG